MPPGFIIFYSLCTIIGAGLSSVAIGRSVPNASPFAQRQWFGPVLDCVLAGAVACVFALYRPAIWKASRGLLRLISTWVADLLSAARSFRRWRPERRSTGLPARDCAVGNRSHIAPCQGLPSPDAVASAAATSASGCGVGCGGCGCGHSGSELTGAGTPLPAATRAKRVMALDEDGANGGKSCCKHPGAACTRACTTAAAAAAAGMTRCQGGFNPVAPAPAGVSTTAAATPATVATVAPPPTHVRLSPMEHARSLVCRAAMREYVSSTTLQRVVVRVPALSPQALPDGWVDAVHAQLVQRYPDMHVLNVSVRHGSLILVLEMAVPGEAVGGQRPPSQEPTIWSQVDASTGTAVATCAGSSLLLPPSPPLQSLQQQRRRVGWRCADGSGARSGTCGPASTVAAAGSRASSHGYSSHDVAEGLAVESGEEGITAAEAAAAGPGDIATSGAESGAQHRDGRAGGSADEAAPGGCGCGGGAGGRGAERAMTLNRVWATLESSLPHLRQGATATVEDGQGGVSLYQYDTGAAQWRLLSHKLTDPAAAASRQPPVGNGGAGGSAGGGEGGSGGLRSGVAGSGAVRAAPPVPALLWMALDGGAREGLAARVVVQPPVLVAAAALPPMQPPCGSFVMGGPGTLDAAGAPPRSSPTCVGVNVATTAAAFAATITASTTSTTSTATATRTTSEPTTTVPEIANAAAAAAAATSIATTASSGSTAAADGAATAAGMAAGTAPSLEQQAIGAAGPGLQLTVRLNLDVYAAVLAPLAAKLGPVLSATLPAAQALAARSPLPTPCLGQFGGQPRPLTTSPGTAATPPYATAAPITVAPGCHGARLPPPDGATAVHSAAATAAALVSELSLWLRLAVPNGRTPLLYRLQKLEFVALAPDQHSSGCAAPAAATVTPGGEDALPGIPQPEDLQSSPRKRTDEQHPRLRIPAPAAGDGASRQDPVRAPQSREATVQAVEDGWGPLTDQRMPAALPAAVRLDCHPCAARHPRPPLRGYVTLLGWVSCGELEPWMQLAAAAAEGGCGPCLLHCEIWHDPTGLLCGSAPVLVLPHVAQCAAASPAAEGGHCG